MGTISIPLFPKLQRQRGSEMNIKHSEIMRRKTMLFFFSENAIPK